MFQRDFYLRQYLIEYFGRAHDIPIKEIDEFWNSLSEKDKDDYAQKLLADVVFGRDGKMFLAGSNASIVAWFALYPREIGKFTVSLGRTDNVVSLSEYLRSPRSLEYVTTP